MAAGGAPLADFRRQAAAGRAAVACGAVERGRLRAGTRRVALVRRIYLAAAKIETRGKYLSPMTPPDYWKQATRELSARDDVIKKLVVKSKGLTLRSRGDAFNTLARSIVGQQISVKAAQSVWNRLVATVPEMRPDIVHAHAPE